MARIAYIGLGVMGAPMARHLLAAGHSLTVANRSPDKARAFVAEHGGTFAPTPAAAAGNAEIVISCVGADKDVEEVTLGADGAFRNMAADTLFIDHTTVSADIARRIAEQGRGQGIACVDAPVSGGQAGAEKGALAIMCGGTPEAMTRAEPVIHA